MARQGRALVFLLAGALLAATAHARRQDDGYFEAIDHPAIGYGARMPTDPVARLSARLSDGSVTLEYDADTGYLPALLEALDIPVASQLAVYSKTSLQQAIISPQNPRAIYFNDSVMVAWPRGGFIEIASHDPHQGVQFYVLPQQQFGPPILMRRTDCLVCHHSYDTLGVPGVLARSVITGPHGEAMPFLGNYLVDDRTPLDERWAGWFVTGSSGTGRHLGNQIQPATRDLNADVTARATSAGAFPDALRGYLSPRSDIVAHLVFNHQIRVINLITRAGFDVRLAGAEQRDVAATAARAARDLVDALLFVDEASLPPGFAGDAGFAAAFAAHGPSDGKGRSLRTLDLHTRLMRYPCSFLIYSDAFDALPPPALDAVYRRMWAILSGTDKDARYARLTPADRQAVIEILRETKKGLPGYFGPSS
jgi:hypothetical protein